MLIKKRKYVRIGRTTTIEGIAYKAVETDQLLCIGCDLYETNICETGSLFECAARHRKDGKKVHFKRVNTKYTVGDVFEVGGVVLKVVEFEDGYKEETCTKPNIVDKCTAETKIDNDDDKSTPIKVLKESEIIRYCDEVYVAVKNKVRCPECALRDLDCLPLDCATNKVVLISLGNYEVVAQGIQEEIKESVKLLKDLEKDYKNA